MKDLKAAVTELIEDHGRIDAAHYILQNKELALYVIDVGINKILAQERRQIRREIKSRIIPQDDLRHVSSGGIRFSASTVKRVHANHQQFLQEWYIGGLSLGNLTKEELLAEAVKEKKAGYGHYINAGIYEILADPLKPGQRMRDYWQSVDEIQLELKRKGLVELPPATP
jgi:hypothetical protein